jgi:hypothetical protein
MDLASIRGPRRRDTVMPSAPLPILPPSLPDFSTLPLPTIPPQNGTGGPMQPNTARSNELAFWYAQADKTRTEFQKMRYFSSLDEG